MGEEEKEEAELMQKRAYEREKGGEKWLAQKVREKY